MIKEIDARDVALGNGVYYNQPGVAVVTWDPVSELVRVEWQGRADSTERKEALDAGLDALIEHRGTRWLADSRDMKAVKQPDQEWIDQSWFPRLLAAGLLRMAVVSPKSGLAKMSIEDILRRVPGSKLDTECFATVEQATEWLTRPPTIPANVGEASSFIEDGIR